MKDSTDIVIHINETLDNNQRSTFSKKVKDIDGVKSASLQDDRPHLMLVAYNPNKIKALHVLEGVNKTGVSAQIVGWL